MLSGFAGLSHITMMIALLNIIKFTLKKNLQIKGEIHLYVNITDYGNYFHDASIGFLYNRCFC